MSSAQVLSVGHTGITVSDLDRSVAFYRDVLGFPATDKRHLGGDLAAKVTGVPGAEIDIVFVSAPGHTIESSCSSTWSPAIVAGRTCGRATPAAFTCASWSTTSTR